MDNFSAAWLALRETADNCSRSTRVAQAIAEVLPRERPVRILDLAAGTGSNARFLTDYFHSGQRWLLVDHDPVLLKMGRADLPSATARRVMDLSKLENLTRLFAGRELVTASALLDLVSEQWLRAVTTACHEHRTAVLFALSYDGRIVCSPAEAEDDLIRELVNQHQLTDKGFGPALGPRAAARASAELEGLGYRVIRDRSDWVVEPTAHELQRQLIDGWAEAAIEIAPEKAGIIAAWRSRRLTHLADGRSRLVVGHEDVGAFIA
jgi:hypothetical protein